MTDPNYSKNVFINCPFDSDYSPLLEAVLFCVVYFGFNPRLANERLENGENRLDKIVNMIEGSKYSIHDLSRCQAEESGEYFRMNMPFEFGIDLGFRKSADELTSDKKYLIFERNPYELKRALSDIAGQDVEFHRGDYQHIVKKVRNFFRVEADVPAPGPTKLLGDYATFQGWVVEKKISQGHSEKEAVDLPTKERLDELLVWVGLDKPVDFMPE